MCEAYAEISRLLTNHRGTPWLKVRDPISQDREVGFCLSGIPVSIYLGNREFEPCQTNERKWQTDHGLSFLETNPFREKNWYRIIFQFCFPGLKVSISKTWKT